MSSLAATENGKVPFRSLIKRLILFAYVYLWCPLRNTWRGVRGRCHVTILMYHRVSDALSDDVTVGVEQFRQQIRAAKRRHEIIDMTKLLASRTAKRRKPVLAVTFDDGYADNYGAADILRQEGVTAVFFICTGIVGTEKPFPHDIKRLGRRVEALTWDQVEEMRSWGHHIASHTDEHPNLAECNVEESFRQVCLGQEKLSERMGSRPADAWFAYPHGRREDLPESVRDRLSECGIEYCFSAYGGVNFPGFDQNDIRRQGINWKFDRLAFLAALEGWQVRMPKRATKQ